MVQGRASVSRCSMDAEDLLVEPPQFLPWVLAFISQSLMRRSLIMLVAAAVIVTAAAFAIRL